MSAHSVQNPILASVEVARQLRAREKKASSRLGPCAPIIIRHARSSAPSL